MARDYLQQSRQVLGQTEAYVIMQQTWDWADKLEQSLASGQPGFALG